MREANLTNCSCIISDPQAVSLRLDPNGWAWLVWKRQLYIWRYTSDGKKNTNPCRELNLPPSELFHHARLVCVVGSGVVPACIAVSPEGHINYWPNISNESATVSINADVPVSMHFEIILHCQVSQYSYFLFELNSH